MQQPALEVRKRFEASLISLDLFLAVSRLNEM